MQDPLATSPPNGSLSRREVLRRILLAAGLATVIDWKALGVEQPRIIGFDPDLLKKEIPWDRVLTEREKLSVTSLGDIIIPADEFGPAASAVGVPDFIDEWVSAPYAQQQRERKIICEGLAWLDAEAQRRFIKGFPESAPEQQSALLDDILAEGSEARRQGYGFFRLFRDRVAGGYYSTPKGWKAIGYVGNVPLPHFPGPPPEALVHLGLV